jgi:ribosomal protein S8
VWVQVPRSQSIVQNNYSYVVNHINIVSSKKQRFTKIKFSKKIFQFILVLYKLGVINSFIVLSFRKKKIKISPLIYKNKPYFSGLRLVTTPSKNFHIKLKTLLFLNNSLGETVLVLETPLGIISHKEAIKHKTGGKILCVLN